MRVYLSATSCRVINCQSLFPAERRQDVRLCNQTNHTLEDNVKVALHKTDVKRNDTSFQANCAQLCLGTTVLSSLGSSYCSGASHLALPWKFVTNAHVTDWNSASVHCSPLDWTWPEWGTEWNVFKRRMYTKECPQVLHASKEKVPWLLGVCPNVLKPLVVFACSYVIPVGLFSSLLIWLKDAKHVV